MCAARKGIHSMPDEVKNTADIALNTILYGPPGTGKTYYTVIYAVAIIEKKKLAEIEEEIKTNGYSEILKRYHEYKEQERIEFTTFHQSYGYEEFIEGIKPIIENDDNEEDEEDETNAIQYQVQSGIVKNFCDKAQLSNILKENEKENDFGFNQSSIIWKVSLMATGDNEIRQDCLDNGHIRIGWDEYGENIRIDTNYTLGGKKVLNAFINRMKKGDIVFSCYSSSEIDAIGVIEGDYEWHEEYNNYKRLRKVKWIVKEKIPIRDKNDGHTMTLSAVYQLKRITIDDVYQLIKKYLKSSDTLKTDTPDNYVFIIDEINRGNISKIFGELITLIEPSKRLGQAEGIKAILPYSQKPFSVPKNLYIIGTMNTADRSIAALDTALRRRFFFKEMQPNPSLLKKVRIEDRSQNSTPQKYLSVSELLVCLNKRITVLYDREHTIGHAYFMPLQEKNKNTLETLAEIFMHAVIPLLQEYFYDDYEKIRLVLGDNQKKDTEIQFIKKAELSNPAKLFGDTEIDLDTVYTYEINNNAFYNIDAYLSILESK